jgi:hypothetical protein
MTESVEWQTVGRPGYFGSRRDEKHHNFDKAFGIGKWRLVWTLADEPPLTFVDACRSYYEESYVRWLQDRPDLVDHICRFHNCIDNSPTNVNSGLDYSIQEARSTHIQDIAVRNALVRLGRWFESPDPTHILEIRSSSSNGFVYGPGNVPFFDPSLIVSPRLTPTWANRDSVECFWQSNKFLQAR